MPLLAIGGGGIMFSGCPCVCAWVHAWMRPSVTLLWAQYLLNPWTDFYETFTIDSLPKEDELIRYSRSWGQRSRSYGVDLENLVGAISPEPLNVFSWNLPDWFTTKGGWADKVLKVMGPKVKVIWCWPWKSCGHNISWAPYGIFMKLSPLIYHQRRKDW